MGAEGEGLSIPREDKRNKCRNLSTEMYGCSENNEANQKKKSYCLGIINVRIEWNIS